MQFQQRLFCAETKENNQATVSPKDSIANKIGSNGSIPLIDADEEIDGESKNHVCESKPFDGSNKVIHGLLGNNF